jgi:pyridoxine 5-phosphate synthase
LYDVAVEHVRLCVNIDHVATVRNARGTAYPDPVHVAVLALNAGADGIVAHLREDRRHIRERDVEVLRASVPYFGFEFALDDEIIAFADHIRPDLAMLVPERRQEVTTESGLDVVAEYDRVAPVVARLQEVGIPVSLFVDPDEKQIEAAARAGARFVELHTGPYSDATRRRDVAHELVRLREGASIAANLGLRVNAGHGLRTDNVGPVAAIPAVEELSIGHWLVARSLFIGMEQAVREMKEAMRG